MSLDIYSSLMQPRHSSTSRPPPPPPPAKARSGPVPAQDDLSSVEQRLLDFFPAAFNQTKAAPIPSQPSQAAVVAAGSVKVAVPSTPKLLSALHSRTPSVSPFARMGLEYADEVDGAVGDGRSVLKETGEESKEEEEEEAAGTSGRDVKQATAELVFATRQRRSTLRDKMAHSRHSSVLSAPAAHKADEPNTVAASSAPAGEQQQHRGRRIISNARMMNAANRPVLHTAAPLSPQSPLSPPPPQTIIVPAADSLPTQEEADGSAVAQKKKKPTAFLSHLAGLIKTPMTATSLAIPRYHAAVEAAADAAQPASHTAATAAAAVELSRAAAIEAQQALKRQTATEAATNEAKNSQQPLTPTARGETKQTEVILKPQRLIEEVKAKAEETKQDQSATETTTTILPVTAPTTTTAQRTAQQQQKKEKMAEEDDDSWDDSESGEDDDKYSSDSSSDSSQHHIASDSDPDSDTFIRSLSSMWTTAKKKQDKQLAKQQRQAAERAQQQRLYGKTLVTGGMIVEREGGRMKREVRRAVKSGRGRDGAKLTLEERKALQMAAVYRQHDQDVKKATQKQEEMREQEDAVDRSDSRPLTPQSGNRVLAAPVSTSSASSPSSPRRRTAPTAAVTATPFVPVRYDAPAMPAEPLPVRPTTEVVFGCNTAVTEEESTRRNKKVQRRGPSLFDLAYGTAAVEEIEANKEYKKKSVLAIDDEEDTEVAHPPTVPVVLPARVLRAAPPVSSHVISEGIAAGLPFSVRPIKRQRRTTESSAVVPAEIDVAAIAQQAIRQHKHNAPPQPSTAVNVSTLSHKAISFSRAPRSSQLAKPSQLTPTAQQLSAKRPRMAAKTKAHLDRLHAAHLEQQQRLQRERREKEERALEGCTFAPQLAAKSEKMAERKRMQDEVQMRLYDMLRGRKQGQKGERHEDEGAEDDAPITWGWQDADQPSPAPVAAADGKSSTLHTTTSTPSGGSSAGKHEKLSRAEVMHAQHRIQQERLREQKQMEDEHRAQQQLAHCTFVPHTNFYAAPASSNSTDSAALADSSTVSAPPAEQHLDEQSPAVSPMVVQKMQTSYEEQFVREANSRQSHETQNQWQPEEQSSQHIQPTSQLSSQASEEEEEDDDDLFATAEVSTARSAALHTSPPVAEQLNQESNHLDSALDPHVDTHGSVTAWPILDSEDQPESADNDSSEPAESERSIAVEAEERDSIHTAFAWAVPAFATDTGEDELESPVHSYPEVVEADERQHVAAEETDEELDELLNTTELAHFRDTLLAAQMTVINDATDPLAVSPDEQPTPLVSRFPLSTKENAVVQPGRNVASDAGGADNAVGGDVRPLLLYVDIALSPDRVERMQLCDGDDLLRCASEFCAKHGLHVDYVSIIEGMLQQQLQQAS